ncbi:lysine-N-methylase [Pelosinus fermentans]|uniref:flagellin lysine-N-methylase n=1 Tax=Pelosinus fermentans TaxID=365349 RepID=UPI0002685FAB|nr:flagellin lysine-N-methylase [Pelosinus fermentans]OAM92877.1 hypothetical protein FR7_00893 [Pelosinus fermentans DSM 17108]SDQ59686.1 lysine-N-methylase [Pelosinus fermentans]
MLSGKKMFIQPQYFSKFRCIGTECEDTCCSGWKVIIDKNTYKKYRECSDKDLRRQMDKQITRNRGVNANDDYYAKIKMDSESNCPFLNNERLCIIQKKMGEEYLSKICNSYPRELRCIDGIIERSLKLSCPEVTRLALLDSGLMEFNEVEDQLSMHNNIVVTIDTTDAKYNKSLEKYFWALRIFTIITLQKRDYLLWERLIILGLFYDNVNNAVNENKLDTIPQVINKYETMIEQGFLHEELKQIPVNNAVQMNLIKTLVDARCSFGVDTSFADWISKFSQGIQYNSEDDIEVNAARYEEIYRKYYEPYIQHKEYILENYMVDYVFKTMFPLSGKKCCFDSYIMMIVHYAIIKMLLIGIAGFYKEKFDNKQIIKLIQSFVKTVEHNPLYLKNVLNCFTENKFTSMAYMAILIKN